MPLAVPGIARLEPASRVSVPRDSLDPVQLLLMSSMAAPDISTFAPWPGVPPDQAAASLQLMGPPLGPPVKMSVAIGIPSLVAGWIERASLLG
jgi:hypothetical protein